MKKTYIIALIVIAVAVGMIITTAGDASRYVTFEEAMLMARKGDNSRIHVVGTLKKNERGEIVGLKYSPETNPNFFSFSLKDSQGKEQTVIYRNPKPADFERSEQVVVIGYFKDQRFEAEKILMKCPSKYQENAVEM